MASCMPIALEVCREHYQEHAKDHGCPACPIHAECIDVRANERKSFGDWKAKIESAAVALRAGEIAIV